MDRKLPRGFLKGLTTHFLRSDPSSSSAVFARHNTLKTVLPPHKNSSLSVMEKNPQDAEKYDKAREGNCKRASDMKPPKRASDYILPHILNLYASRATSQDFDIYVPHATFEDPLMCAHGVQQIKSAFYSLAKVFSESRIVDYSVVENTISPGKTEILIDNKQYYKFLGKGIDVISLIKLYTDDGKVVRHEDWWDKKPLWNRETVRLPFVAARRVSMLTTHVLMSFGKDPHL